MQVTTWIDRITGENNLWLSAVRCEDQDDYPRAFELYLEDAVQCLARDQLAKAALSCGSAADCLARVGLGSQSRLLYRETAAIYLEEAKRTAASSLREYLWTLRESYGYFTMADQRAEAEEVLRIYERVVRRVDPLGGEEQSLEALSVPQKWTSVRANLGRTEASRLIDLVDQFLQSRKTGSYIVRGSPMDLAPNRTAARRARLDEKSIINQLG
jgi:hypothetical protein